jgi:hypothetical protein
MRQTSPRSSTTYKDRTARTIPLNEGLPKPFFTYGTNPGLNLPVHGQWKYGQFLQDDNQGKNDYFADSEYEHELHFGLDFGTSTIKAIIFDDATKEKFVIPFIDRPGVDAYLLPSALYVDKDNVCSLIPPETSQIKKRFSSLKLSLMSNPHDRENRIAAIAFLALAVRHARGWFYKRYPKYASPTFWIVRIGVPSGDDKKNLISIWRNLMEAAWMLSGIRRKITLELAETVYQSLDTNKPQCGPVFEAFPEVAAETIAFINDHPYKEGQHYLIADVGSGTLDLSLFTLSQSPVTLDYHLEAYEEKISPLGTTNCHHRRIEWIGNTFEKDLKLLPGHFQNLLRVLITDIKKEKDHSLRSPFVNSYLYYLKDITSPRDRDNIDAQLITEIAQQIIDIQKSTFINKKLAPEQIQNLHVFLCGGGALSEFYKASVGVVNKITQGHTWMHISDIQYPNTIRNLNTSDYSIGNNDHCRFLVASGLCFDGLNMVESVNHNDMRLTPQQLIQRNLDEINTRIDNSKDIM